jgi:hypothetical protein
MQANFSLYFVKTLAIETEKDKNGPKWTRKDQKEPKLDQNGPEWTTEK